MSVTSNIDVRTNEDENNDNVTDRTLLIEHDIQNIRFTTYKNLVVISLAFLLQYTAYDGIRNLQSSLNTDDNIGVNSLSIIYVFMIISSVFLPHPMIAMFGLKWTLLISQVP